MVPDVEQFVSAGAQVFGAVSTSDLANIVAAGGQGFEGQAASLRQLLNALSSVTAGYAGHTPDIQRPSTASTNWAPRWPRPPAPTPRR